MKRLLVVLGPEELAATSEGVAWGLPLVAQAVAELPEGATVLAGGGEGPGGWARRWAERLGRRWVELGPDGVRRQHGAEPRRWREGGPPPIWHEHARQLVDAARSAREAGWAVRAVAAVVPGALGPAEWTAAWLERDVDAVVVRVEVPSWILEPPRKPRRPLQVWTAPAWGYRGHDAQNVTRGRGDPVGLPFAPSWSILSPMLDARRLGGDAAVEPRWPGYVKAYEAEMRRSQAEQPAAWLELLSRRSVTLQCFCPRADRCHRTVLARMLEGLGADVRGERPRAGEARRAAE